MPFSSAKSRGFEIAIAELVADDLGARLETTWWPQRRGFVRMTLKRGDCDVVMGVPSNFEQAQPTEPYYRSSYVFVSRNDRHLNITSRHACPQYSLSVSRRPDYPLRID